MHLTLKNSRFGLRKHKRSLLIPYRSWHLNDHEDGERMEYLGHSLEGRILYVVTVEQSDDEIRIVSARTATNFERKTYEEERI
ncbi:MAG: BrnT family toxin [Bdellovibrionales bacterium]|nr:BrnT family toxin [Bdellovibrionales bacterium]